MLFRLLLSLILLELPHLLIEIAHLTVVVIIPFWREFRVPATSEVLALELREALVELEVLWVVGQRDLSRRHVFDLALCIWSKGLGLGLQNLHFRPTHARARWLGRWLLLHWARGRCLESISFGVGSLVAKWCSVAWSCMLLVG